MILAGVVTVVIVLVVALWIGAHRQQRALSGQVDRLIHAAAAPDVATPPGSQGTEAVPDPVARYLRWALRTTKYIQEVRISQIGTLRTDVRSERWMSFEAEQIVVPPAVGFVWDARVRVAPLLHWTRPRRADRGPRVWTADGPSLCEVL